MANYIELKPSEITMVDSTYGFLRTINTYNGRIYAQQGGSGKRYILDFFDFGNFDDRPSFGNQGKVYYATDINKLYVDTGISWQEISNRDVYNLSGNFADRPDAGISGRWYFSTDTRVLYFDTGSDWLAIQEGVTNTCLDTYMSSDQSISNNTDTLIAFDTVNYDLNSEFDPSGPNVTVKETGYYNISVGAFMTGLADQCSGNISIHFSGVPQRTYYGIVSGVDIHAVLNSDFYIEAGKMVFVYAFQDSGNTGTIKSGKNHTWFSMHKLLT